MPFNFPDDGSKTFYVGEIDLCLDGGWPVFYCDKPGVPKERLIPVSLSY